MKTHHRLIHGDARSMEALKDSSVDLVVTSPPYPMIAMWDGVFESQDPEIQHLLEQGRGMEAFERMHRVLDAVWRKVFRVLKPGGLACINIGDATRTVGGEFSLYPNHARILSSLSKARFSVLPEILWRKQTNAPNKFMGSGMLPGGAYVTLEHEFILIVRKGGKREFVTWKEKENRQKSAYFWEERNLWFSDVWMDLKGVRQKTGPGDFRDRSGAFPFELPYRLINMYSVREDVVLDPFAGLGTTLLAAMALGRNSVGYELDGDLCKALEAQVQGLLPLAGKRMAERIGDHALFVKKRFEQKGEFKYKNQYHGIPVMTRQEISLELMEPHALEITGPGAYEAALRPLDLGALGLDWPGAPSGEAKGPPEKKGGAGKRAVSVQERMFE